MQVIATHFDELTKQNLLPDSGYLGIRTMSVMADRSGSMRPYAVQIWSRDPPIFEATKPS